MFKYLINGELFEFSTERQRDNILAQAKEKGFSIELVKEEVAADFQTDSVEDVNAVSEIVTSEDTESTSVDGSLDFPTPDSKEETEKGDEGVKTMDSYIEDTFVGIGATALASAGSFFGRVPTFFNELTYGAIGNLFLSDEDKEAFSNLDPKIQSVILNSQAGASSPTGSVSIAALEFYYDAKKGEEQLRSEMEQFDNTILQDLGQGNLVRGLQRASSSALQSIPSVLQSMIPYVGIASIAAGAAAEASVEAQEEGKGINMKTMFYATTKGIAEGLLETVTRGIGKKMFKSLAGKSKELINKSVKEIIEGVAKDAGAEGGSEGLTEVVNVIAENIYLGKETSAIDAIARVGEAALVGSVMGGKMSGTGSAGGILVNTIQTNKVDKKLEQSEFDSLKDSFNLETGLDQNIIDLVQIRGALDIVENKAKKEVLSGEITKEEASDIVGNFKEIQTATKQAKAAKIEKDLQPEIVDNLAKKNKLEKQIKEINDPVLSAPLKEEVDLLDTLIKKGTIASVTKKNLKNVEKVAEGFKDVEIKEVDNKEAIEIASKVSNETKESTGYGFIYQEDGVSKIVINKDEVATDNVLNTGAHEFLHFALKNIFKSANTDATYETLATSVGNLLASSELVGDTQRFNQRLEDYQAEFEEGNISAGQLFEEQLVVLSEAMLDGEFDIKKNPSIMANLKDLARRLLSVIGVKAKFNSDEDILNFIKDYNRSISKGKFTLGQKRLIKEGAKGKLITKKEIDSKESTVKQSMSKKMQNLVDRQEAIGFMEGSMDAAELDLMKEEVKQEINELRAKEGVKPKTATKAGPKAPMTLEEADEAYEDAIEAWNEAPDNMALEAEVEKALRNVEAAKQVFDAGEEIVVEPKAEAKPAEKAVREKKDRSTKRYTLTDEAKAKIEPLIEKAQAMNKELIAKEKKLNDDKIASIRSTPETVMSRTEQANAVSQAKANPIRLPKPVELRRIETEIRDRLEKPMGKAITFFTKLLYDRIPKEAANVIGGRDAYKSAAEARILSIVINEFKKETINRQGEKTTNDIEDIIFNRGGLRLLTLATDLGVVDSSQGIAGTLEEGKIGDYGNWDKAFDEGPVKMDVDGMFRVSSLLGDSGRMAEAMEQVAEFWKDNIGNSPIENFKKLPSLVDDIVADMLNISRNVLTARSGNLNKDDYNNALKGITKPYAVYKVEGKDVRVSPEFAEELENRLRNEGKSFERFADQNILQTLFKFLPKLSADDYRYADRTKGRYSGKATGVPKNLVKLTYSGLERGTTGMGNMKARVSKVAYKDVLAALGGFVNADGVTTKLGNASGRTPEGQTLLGVIKLMNRMITNDISRNSNMGLDPMTVQDIAAGKNDLMMSMKRPMKRSIEVPNVELQKILDDYYKENPNSSFIQQVNGVLNQLAGYDSTIRGFFKYHAKQYALDNKIATTEDVAKQFSAAWGKFHKYIEQEVSFKAAIDEISTGTPTQASLENFFVLYARAMKNKKYQGASNNKLLWNLVSSNIKNSENQPQSQKEGSKMLNDLGFSLRIPLNKNGKEGSRSYIDVTKIIKDENGNDKTVTEPISSPLSIEKIKSLAKPKGDNLNVNDIKTIGDQTVEDSIRYIKLVMDHLDRLIRSGQTQRAIADIYTMGLGQLTPIRKIATLGTVYKFKGEGILEHADSVFLMQEKLREYVANEKRDRTSLEKYLDEQRVNVIPKSADPKQKVGTAKEKYADPNTQEELKDLGKRTYSKGAGKKRIAKKAKAENALASMKKAMDRAADTKRKGISVLDFDDTLARTNSNVLYTMPNGTTGKLTAEEFAKNGDMMSSKGAEWDFSEFSKVVDGKKGPLFEKTKRLVAKFGNENVFVLTARPANSKFAIHEFLSGLGLDIPLQNITGLADSNPQAKGDWITGKAAEGYNDFFFADDHIKNVIAVGQAMNDAGVKGKSILADPSIKYSLKIKRNYVNQVTKGRPDLNEDQIAEQMDFVMSHVEGMVEEGAFPPNKLAKYKKLGLHFLAKSPLILPEDGYKINEAIQIAEQKNIDPFKYNNPNDLMDKFAGTVKAKRVDPDNVKEFSNKKVLPKGVTVYDVSNNREGQEAVRKVLDTHVNPKANPWCAFARTVIRVWERDEYLRTRQPENVDSAFVSYEFTYQDTGEVETDYYPMSSINNKINLSREEMVELAEGGFGPGFINAIPVDQQGAQQNEDSWEEVHQDNGRMGRIKYKEYYLLTDREQTQQEFLDSGGLKYPPGPKTNKLVKDESYMGYDMFEHYGTGRPGRTVTEDVDGETKVVKKEDATPGGWKIAFVNEKLKSVKNLGGKEQKWWDLRDVATDDLKISKDGPGERTVMNIETGKTKKIPADPSMKWSMKRDKKLNKAIDHVVNLDRNNDRTTKGKASQPKLIRDLVDVFDMDGEGQSLLDKATRMLDLQWNELYKDVTGVDPNIEFGDVEAQKLGDEVSKSTISRIKAITRGYLVESGADDFLGLLYRTLPKGKKGEAMMKLYEDNLLKPFAIASREVEKARIKMAKRYRDIKTNNGISDKVLNGKLTLKTESGKDVTYTSEDAVRVYMWRKQGIEVPGLSEENELDLAEHVKSSDELYSFALNLMNNTLPDEFADPKKNWVTGSLKTDYLEGINNTQRKDALRFWEKGVEAIFSESNMKKIKAQHGSKFADALSNSLERMRTGRNTMQGLDSDTKIMLQFISGAVGNIMFLNTRSAGLQLLSATNFMEAGDNTWGKSLKTIFTKMPTLLKDYKMLMDTDFLLDRRNALKMDVNDSDIARIAQGKGIQGKLARFLQWGYVFTQAADSRAIALGGAVYYRNKYNQLIKEGVDPKTAKEQALLETTEHAQSSQQSSRADKISKQQASTSGRLMLAFANTPMQYNRIVQKSYLDLVNNRGSKRKNLYNIAYYGLAQNLLFTVAQGAMLTAVYGTLFGDDEDEKLTYDQQVGVANGVLSSWLRGMGIWGNGLNALKQTFMNIHKESKKKRPQYDVAAIKGLTSIMPAVGSKISKIYATTRAFEYNKDFLFDVNEGNVFKNYAKMPGVIALGQTAALFNVPLDRAQRKIANLIDAVNYAQSDLTTTAGLLFGHSLWTLQTEEEKKADYEEQKQRRKGIKKGDKIKEEKSKLTPEELKFSDLKDLKKQQQIDSLTKYGLSKKQIRLLKYEKDRVEAIIKLQNQKRKNSLK